jgi:outer membrane protein assembly factor BamB
MRKNTIFLSTLIFLLLLTSCEFNRSLEGETVNLMADVARTSNYEKYGELYSYSAYVDMPVIDDTVGSYVPPLALAANKIALTNLNGKVMLLTGRNPEWIAQLDSNAVAMAGMAADKNQNLYLIANNDVLYSFSRTGKLKWKHYFPPKKQKFFVYSDLLIVSDGILVGSSSGLLAKLDFDGKVLWEKSFVTGISRSFSADNKDNLIIPLTNNSYGKTDSLLYLDSNGNAIWMWHKINFRIMGYPVFNNGVIYIIGSLGSSNDLTNHFIALDTNCEEIWEYELSAIPRSISVDNEGDLYVISYDIGLGKTISIASKFSKDGHLKWEKYFETKAYSPIIIGNEYIMFAGRKPNTSGAYFMEKSGTYIKTVSLSNLPELVMRPEVKPDGVIIFAGSSRLSIVRIDDIWVNKIIPW